MELKNYFGLIKRRWRLVLLVALVAVVASLFLTGGQSAEYDSAGTYLIKPRADEPGEAVRATDALNRGVEINSTYARIARSDVVESRAKEIVRSAGLPTSQLRIRARVLPGTNLLEIGATGPDPESVAAYAAAVGAETSAYLDELEEVYTLQEVDPPEVPDDARPTRTALTVALAAVMGALAGSGLVFVAEYLREDAAPNEMNIRDTVTGAYSGDFFRMRYHQELSRCNIPDDRRCREETGRGRRQSSKGIVSIGVMTVGGSRRGSNGQDRGPRPIDLRDAANAMMPRLRDHDVLAYLGDDRFAVMFPDMPLDKATKVLDSWSRGVADSTTGSRLGLRTKVSVCECSAAGLIGDDETVRVADAI